MRGGPRRRGRSKVIYAGGVVATILVVLAAIGLLARNSTPSLGESCAARVRDRCIEPDGISFASRMLSPTHGQAESGKTNLKSIALDGLIERELLNDAARRLGIGITDKELDDQLRAGFVRVSVPAEDPVVAQRVLIDMYQAYKRLGVVSEAVAQAHYYDRDTAIPVDFRDPETKLFDATAYERKVKELGGLSTAWLREQQGRELLAAKVRDSIRDPVRLGEDEAWNEYERDENTATLTVIPVVERWAQRWATDVTQTDIDVWLKNHRAALDKAVEERKKDDMPQAGHIRHILVKLPPGASNEQRVAASAKLSWAANRVRAGELFAEVARQMSDDTTTGRKGGDLGDKLDTFFPAIKAMAEKLTPGETSPGPVETEFGLHLLERDAPSTAAALEERLRRSVARELVVESRALEAAQSVARKIVDAIRGGKGVEDALKDTIALYVHSNHRPDASRFDASTDDLRPRAQTSSTFNGRSDPFPGLTPDGAAGLMAFAFSGKPGDVMEAPLRAPEGYRVVVLKERRTVTRREFDRDRETFEQELLRAKRDQALSLYIQRLREQAGGDIVMDEAYVRQAAGDGGAQTQNER